MNLDKQLIEACRLGLYEVAKYLILNGADVHTNNDWPLRLAFYYNHYELAKYLILNGANVHTYNNWPLRLACFNGHYEIAKLLIDSGVNVTKQTLHYAKRHPKILKLLKEENIK